MHKLVRAVLALLLLGLAGCAGFEDPAFEDEPVATIAQATRTPAEEPTEEPTTEVEEPTKEVVDEPTAVGDDCVGPDLEPELYEGEGWSVQYPSEVMSVKQLTVDVTIFMMDDNSGFFAVDTYHSDEPEFGNTGEGLRNRARQTASMIYGEDVEMVDVLENPDGPWEMGITFDVADRREGEALYEQAGFEQGDKQVYGVLYSYRKAERDDMRCLFKQMRETFERKR